MHRRPTRRYPKATATTGDRPPRDCLVHCIDQFLRSETPHHGDDAIMAANGMKSKGKLSKPESRRRDPASPEITHDHAHVRDPSHFAKEQLRIIAGKVMQQL